MTALAQDATVTLHAFHKHTDRIKMANIAQVANVLQNIILTDTEGTRHIVLTPTYHVFKMYTPFQGATAIPLDIQCGLRDVKGGMMYRTKDGVVPFVSATAARTVSCTTVIALANTPLKESLRVAISLGIIGASTVGGEILTAGNVAEYNDFDHPERVSRKPFHGARILGSTLGVKMPPMSIVTLEVR